MKKASWPLLGRPVKMSCPEVTCVWVLKVKASFLGSKRRPLAEKDAPIRYENVGLEQDVGVDFDGVEIVNLRAE